MKQWFNEWPASSRYIAFCVTVVLILQIIQTTKG